MHATVEQARVEHAHSRWRELKNDTSHHSATCPCAKCRERRLIARDLNLPPVGRINVRRLRLA